MVPGFPKKQPPTPLDYKDLTYDQLLAELSEAFYGKEPQRKITVYPLNDAAMRLFDEAVQRAGDKGLT